MSKIEQLIQELCPGGVKSVLLKDVCSIISGGDVPQNTIKGQLEPTDERPYPVYSNGIEEKSLYGYCDSYKVDNEAVTISARGTIGWHIYRLPFFTPIVRLITLIPNDLILPKFVDYILGTTPINGTKGGIPQLTVPSVSKIKIPLPPLPIQQEIVRILDTFTEAQANLEQELELRKKQYEYYRNQLLTFDENDSNVTWMKLNEVCEVVNGRAYKQQELLGEGKYRVLRVGNFFSNDSWYYSDLELEDKYYALKGDLLYAWSASFGPHIWDEEKVIYHYHIWKMICSGKLSKKFMFYWLQSSAMENQVSSSKHGATMAHLTKALMEQLVLPIPSQERQQEIVSILDKFESTIQTIEEELALRKKQYEYYREKLLTFN